MDQVSNNNFREDMIESQIAFEDQFNPNSGSYHNGIKVFVPIGGSRVPESMPTVYPENVTDLKDYIQKPQIQQYGPEYEQIQATREFLSGRLKKTLAQVSMFVESLFRHKEIFKAHNNNNDIEKAQQVFDKNMQKDRQNLENSLNELSICISYLDSKPEFKDRYQELHIIQKQALIEKENKEQIGEFNFAVKRISVLSFKDCQSLLDKLKQIKKKQEQLNKPQISGQIEEQKNQSQN